MKYIDTDQLKAEIRRRLSLIYLLKGDFTDGSRDAYEGLLSWLDTLPEQSEVDLEKGMEEYFKGWTETDEGITCHYQYVDLNTCRGIARHFAECERKRTLDKVVEWMKKNLTYTHPRKGVETCMVNIGVFLDAMGMGAENLKK